MSISSKAGFLSGMFGGFLAGAVTFALLNYFPATAPGPGIPDAVSIANTYIVFTTLIFVAITLFLAVAGLWFTQQFATSKEMQTKQLIAEIEEQLLANKNDMGVELISKAFTNAEVSQHVKGILESKVKQLVKDISEHAKGEQAAAQTLSDKLNKEK
ncbi:MAG: hypothetical protein ABIT83_05875 [Massilia sp.]